MEIDEYISQLTVVGGRMASAAALAGTGAFVPSCPEWQVADLLRHTGGVHRWATSYVLTGRPGATSDEEDAEYFAEIPAAELVEWFEEGHGQLVNALSEAPSELSCWTFLPAPSPLAFWVRRQAHETAIHCADAELAAGLRPSFPAGFAADGIDELLNGFFSRPKGRLKADPPVSLAVSATDTGEGWTIVIDVDRRRVTSGVAPAACTISGSASALYLLLWNRAPSGPVNVDGDRSVLQLWRDKARVTWS